MLVRDSRGTTLSIPGTLKALSIAGGTLGILIVALSVVAYAPDHSDFSPFTTYLSDIGDTAGWPQAVFNSGTLITSPIRFLVLALVVMRLGQFGTGRGFAWAVLSIGALGALGTVLMTAVPFSVSPTLHKVGIPLYFFGVVPMQIIIGLREWRLRAVPRGLPVISFALAGAYGAFFTLMVLFEMGAVGRDTPVIWQWAGFALSIVWVYAHGIVLGRREPVRGAAFTGTAVGVET